MADDDYDDDLSGVPSRGAVSFFDRNNLSVDDDGFEEIDGLLNIDFRLGSAKTPKVARVSSSVRIGHAKTTRALHSVCAASFGVRAVYLLVRGGSRLKVCESALVAGLYLFIGVFFEWRSERVAEQRSLRRLLHLSQHLLARGDDEGGSGGEDRDESAMGADCSFFCFANYAYRVTLPLGVLGAVLAWIPTLLRQDFVGQWSSLRSPGLEVAQWSCVCCWACGEILFGPGKIEEVGLEEATRAVNGMIARVKKRRASSIPWRTLALHVRVFDTVLTDAFRVKCLGGLWISRIVTLLGFALFFSAVSLVHPQIAVRSFCTAASVLCAAGGTGLLLRLVALTEKCSSTQPGGNSIASAVYHEMGIRQSRFRSQGGDNDEELMVTTSRSNHAIPSDSSFPRSTSRERELSEDYIHVTTLQNYLLMRRMGPELCGLLITGQLVFTVGIRMCFYAPVASAVLGHYLLG